MTEEQAIELENHFLTAAKALECAYKHIPSGVQFEKIRREATYSIRDSLRAGEEIRSRFIKG